MWASHDHVGALEVRQGTENMGRNQDAAELWRRGQVPVWQILSVMILEMVATCLSVTPALGVILSPK